MSTMPKTSPEATGLILGMSRIESKQHLDLFFASFPESAKVLDHESAEVLVSAQAWLDRRIRGTYTDFIVRAKMSDNPADQRLKGWMLATYHKDIHAVVVVALHTLKPFRCSGVATNVLQVAFQLAEMYGAAVVLQCYPSHAPFYRKRGLEIDPNAPKGGPFVFMRTGVKNDEEQGVQAMPLCEVKNEDVQAPPLFEIRWATPEDWPLIQEYRTFELYSPNGVALRGIVRDGLDREGNCPDPNYCLVVEGRGYAFFRRPSVSTKDGRPEQLHWYINGIYVLPEARRCGVGAALVRAIIALAGRAPLHVEAERPAIPFWSALGFYAFRGDVLGAGPYTDMERRATSTRVDSPVGPAKALAPCRPSGTAPMPGFTPLILAVWSTDENTIKCFMRQMIGGNTTVLGVNNLFPFNSPAWELLKTSDGKSTHDQLEIVDKCGEMACSRVDGLVDRCKSVDIVFFVALAANECVRESCADALRKLSSRIFAHLDEVDLDKAPPMGLKTLVRYLKMSCRKI